MQRYKAARQSKLNSQTALVNQVSMSKHGKLTTNANWMSNQVTKLSKQKVAKLGMYMNYISNNFLLDKLFDIFSLTRPYYNTSNYTNWVWIQSSSLKPASFMILREGIWISIGKTASMPYTKEKGVAPVEVCVVVRYPCRANDIISC